MLSASVIHPTVKLRRDARTLHSGQGTLLSELRLAAAELNNFVHERRSDLRFTVRTHHGNTPEMLIVDAQTGAVLREMPITEALRAASYLEHDRRGLIRHRS